ncbi:MAG: WD40/YVTN/BNR-like repeat-containing protein [Omnitrophica WOR_2 bacterium]
MTTKHTNKQEPWVKVGEPPAGSIAAVAIGCHDGTTFFIGTQVGLYRSTTRENAPDRRWERLSSAPLGILSLAASPHYAEDRSLIAGTDSGIFLSRDAGDTWQPARMPISRSTVLALAFSPDYDQDSALLAGTLEDGVFYSDTRGESWSNRGFGMLDPTVYSLAFSPNYAQDGILFAATETAIYYSYNRARAWKQLGFPEGAAPALSVAISPDFQRDRTLFAGTEQQGLYRSTDSGQQWERVDLPAACVNALLYLPDTRTLLAATEAGIFQTADQGDTWDCLADIPDALNLVSNGEVSIAGTVDQGAWISEDRSGWKPVANLSTRLLLGLALSPGFEQDRLAYLYGLQEGIWRTANGGSDWTCLNENLPSLDIQNLACSPDFASDRTILAASPAGLLLSEDAGENWQLLNNDPATNVCFSPDGRILAATSQEGVFSSIDQGKTWQKVTGPWDAHGKIAALAITNSAHYYIASLEGVQDTVAIWQGKAGEFEQVLNQPANLNPVVSFWIPAEPAVNRPWYASLGNQVMKFSSRRGSRHTESSVFESGGQDRNIIGLTGVQTHKGAVLFACTGQHLFQSADAKAWTLAHDFKEERAISIALSPEYLETNHVYALLLGGAFLKGIVRP